MFFFCVLNSLTEGKGFLRGQKLETITRKTNFNLTLKLSMMKLSMKFSVLVGQGPRELNLIIFFVFCRVLVGQGPRELSFKIKVIP